jgi:oxygen-independent coproporphyrinogen-3 oxidase
MKQPLQYLERVAQGEPLLEEHDVGRAAIGFEFMLNALRLAEGVPTALFAERTGYPITIVEQGLAEAERRGLLDRDHQRIRPTALGRRFLNDLQAIFLPVRTAERKPVRVPLHS